MKNKIIAISVVAFVTSLLQVMIVACSNSEKKTGEEAIKKFFYTQTDSLLEELDSLSLSVKTKQQTTKQFLLCRLRYKKTEAITEYYFQGLTKRINGPALPDIKPEDGQVWPPHGFQVIEQFIFEGYDDTAKATIINEIKLLQTDLLFVKNNLQHQHISPRHISELIQHQFIRIATMGITGFDAPISKLSLEETAASLKGIDEIASLYNIQSDRKKLTAAINYIMANNDFDNFDRLGFLQTYLVPLSNTYLSVPGYAVTADSMMRQPFSGSLENLLTGKGFDADYYSTYAVSASSPEKIELGKQLFFDKQLSRSGSLSCASCHQPDLFFTDGKTKAGDFIHGGSLMRNTPTLYYAGLQSNQFYDLRSTTLEDQAHEVMNNGSEFNFTPAEITKRLLVDQKYKQLFKKGFEGKDSIGGYEVRNAIAAFVRSLSPFSSPFDEYMKGNKSALSTEEIKGFNLFAGKAKCATCHFIPLFNGNIPPWFVKSESEIIGVPAKPVWNNALIDNDSGRYKINQLQELLFAFKTPTVRNVQTTAPYMHNGVYKTLEEVVEFYHKGGGVGLGINLPFQSLPFDSLSLNQQEKKAIVAFMHSLTDKKNSY